METLTIIEKIIALLVTLTVGGVIGALIKLRWTPKIEKANAEKAEAEANAEDINNAKSLIDLYKQALEDLRKLNEKNEAKYIKKLEELETELNDCKLKMDDIITKSKEKDNTIKDLMKSQLSFKMELQNLRALQNDKCSDCIFSDGCEKFRAFRNSSSFSKLD